MATAGVRKIPGPRAVRVIGPYWNYIRLFTDSIQYMRERYARYGKLSAAPVEFNEGERGWIFAFGPEYNQLVLSNPAVFYSPSLGGTPDTPQGRLSTGLVFMNGEHHRQHRRMIMPAFHKKYIESYRDDMVNFTNWMLAKWRAGETRDIARDMRELALHIANKTLFGLDSTVLKGEREDENIGDLIARWLALNVSPLARIFPYDLPGFAHRRMLQISEQLEQRILEVVAHKRSNLSQGNDVLATLLQVHDEDGTRLTDEEVIGQTNILFVAGHETSATTLTWTLFLLAQHPQVLADVLDEIEGKLHGETPTVEQLNDLPLLERVLKETLRLMPPLTWAQRDAIEPFEIGPYHMPKGSGVLISHFITHHLPELYSQPEKFMPDRWLTIDPSPYEYLPFSAGSRMCIGASFAMMEMKIVLAMLLPRFRLTPLPGTTVDYRVLPTLVPKRGLPMQVQAQDRRFEVVSVQGRVRELVELP